MLAYFQEANNFKAFADKLYEFDQSADVRGLIVLTADANHWDATEVDPLLKSISTPLIGALVPELIYGEQKVKTGFILVGLSGSLDVALVDGISDPQKNLEAAIEAALPRITDAPSMFVFVDGFSTQINKLIGALYNTFGSSLNYIGGGAGSLSFVQQPCVYCNQGVKMDAVVLGRAGVRSKIGVKHGWSPISEPLEVTDSEKNTIYGLNHQPAFQVYKKLVEAHSNRQFSGNNFFDIAKAYPFGMNKLGGDNVVRDPLQVGGEDSLVCVGEVPEGAFVQVLTGDPASLISAAKEASFKACEPLESLNNPFIFLIDCVSRALFLGEEFHQEIQVVSRTGIHLVGALTLGEIANDGDSYLEFYNKTIVVGLLESL